MIQAKRLFTLALAALALALLPAIARAQDQSAPATPAPTTSQDHMTPMDRAYDGKLHITAAPYLWLPTLRANIQYSIPKLPTGGSGVGGIATNVQVGPSDYLTNLNSAGMMSISARMGDVEFLGDGIFTNLSSNANFYSTINGPLGKVHIPLAVSTSARTASSIWELAAGVSIAHGHNADLNIFAGWRQFPLTNTLGYDATIGAKPALTASGTVKVSPMANDVIFGINGKVFLGDGHWYAPYYVDMGAGATQQTWEGYGGAGYAFDHGQTMVLAFRTLNYNAFPTSSPIQKLSMWGPLLGYTFQL